VTIPLDSHIGPPAKPAVQEGDLVKRGDVIGTVEADKLGCPAHASIDGRVVSVSSGAISIAAG
jgi:Na+-translocating ferredoxin:NAD+ oxidoreductase RnfC subunit